MDLYNKGVHPSVGGSGKASKLMRADLWIVVSGREYWLRRGTARLLGDGNVLYLDPGGDYMGINIF